MKKYQNYLMVVIFFSSQIVLASGNGPSLQNKSVSAKDCPEGTEYKIQNKGVWGCYPKDAAEIDSSCNESFFENFEAKQSCLLDLNSASCLTMSFLATAGGTAVGGYAGKMLESVINKQTPEVQKKFLAAITEIKAERVTVNKAFELWQKSRDKAFEEYTKDQYKTEDEWRSAQKTLVRIPDDVYKIINKNQSTLLSSDLPDDVKESLKGIGKNSEAYIDTRLQEKIEKLFPEEGKVLRQLYQAKYNAWMRQMKLNPYMQEGQLYAQLEDEIADVNSKLYDLKRPSARYQLVDALMQQGYASTYLKSYRKNLFEAGKTAAYFEKEDLKVKTKNYGRNGAVAGTALVSGALIGDALLGQADIRNCQKDYGFSNSEIEYLGNNNIFSIAKAKKKNGWSCDNLAIVDSQNLFEDMKAKFGGTPKGICKMAKMQSKNLDKLMGEFSANPSGSCEKMSDANLSVYKDGDPSPTFTNNSGKDVFEFRSGSFVYKMPFNDGINYPDFRFIKAFDENGREVRNESLRMQDFYNKLHPANITDARPDLIDLQSSCSENSHNGSLFCNMKQAAVRVRVGRSISSSVCSFSDVAAGPKRTETKNSATAR